MHSGKKSAIYKEQGQKWVEVALMLEAKGGRAPDFWEA